MKILQINKYYYRRGGSESVYFNTIDLLQKHGHETIYFATNHPRNIECPGFEQYFANAPELRDLPALEKVKDIRRFFRNKDAERKLDQLLKEHKPDIAHIHNFFNGLGLGILKVLKKHNVPVVISLHDARFICPSVQLMNNPGQCLKCQKQGYTGCLKHRCYEGSLALSGITMMEMWHKEWLFKYNKYIDRYIFLSKRFRDLFAQKHDWFDNKGELLYNFNAAPHAATHERGKYMLIYGRVCKEKGVYTLLEAAKRLPDIKFVMAGTGPEFDNIAAQKPNNLEMPGFVSGQALIDMIKGAEFVVVPSEWEENNPMTVIEAYGYGRPVIGSDRGGIPEIVPEGQTGYIFPSKDVDALAKTIEKAHSLSDAEYEAMSRAAAKFAHENFDAEIHYNRLMDIYNRAINK